MSQPEGREFFVVGVTHVDLAWKRGRAEMSEMLEIVVIRLLDLLERDPSFRYHLEQAAHFRAMEQRRPDLIDRLRPHLQSGRLEFAGAMASTLEANLPNGECFIRNQEIGLRWVRDTWGVEVKTGWLVDTFGIPAQVPQILQGFGISRLMANRFGGAHSHDLFLDRGLDGSTVTVAGWGTYAGYIPPVNIAEQFYKNWDDIDRCFAKADALTGPGPFLLVAYTENEMLVSERPRQITAERGRERPGETWRTATPGDYFDAVGASGRTLPVVDGDLNPEFTGCFSLRHAIRLRNRAVETRLLEAEKWAAFAGIRISDALEDAWWEIAYAQFHDVFTGSHPTEVYRDLMRVFEGIELAADTVLESAFARLAPAGPAGNSDSASLVVFNGLPWNRSDVAEFTLPDGWTGIGSVTDADGTARPFAVENGMVRVRADVPAVGHASFRLTSGAAAGDPPWETVDAATLENDLFRVEIDTVRGIGRLVWKPTGAVLLENIGALLVAQRDDGNFQIENPTGPEVTAASGSLKLETRESPLGREVRLSGEFPPLAWAGPDNHLRWKATFTLRSDRPAPTLAVSLHLDWKGEASRLRLMLPTRIDSSVGIYEVPFGVVQRRPYTPRANARGEWPTHRFVAVEDAAHGIVLINTGVGGVEVNGGTIYTTLLRAPKGEYAGMVADATSSQHGTHDFSFEIAPYAGSWSEAGVIQAAQELNNPLLTSLRAGSSDTSPPATSFLSVTQATVVLSGVKSASDGSGDIIVRVYETAGKAAQTRLAVPGVIRARTCDLRENSDSEMSVSDGALSITLTPFQIQTLRLSRDDGQKAARNQ